ncbi:putative conserved lipoprotein LpqF [Microtetraspora sp. NBRC 13810]|uniref:serine hydrolase n=1 Tax=Microtetraspora sp. NBRC 13810 TaxID=3030990 RepID=UPI0024A44719|nr:serine hydrolase [Microtetraspora sp. NBRC 13810]GLW12338.1 putative conserved lipoprotein LpqF [Microtetraspora sp. NBRC 13810]
MHLPKKRIRVTALALAGVSLLATACAGGEGAAPTTTASPSPSATPTAPEVEIPATPAGDQLRWLLAAIPRAPLPEAELAEHVHPAFLAQVPPAQFNQFIQSLAGLRLTELTGARPDVITATTVLAGQNFVLSITVDGTGKIVGLTVRPPQQPRPTPASWSEIDERLRAIAPRVGFLAAEVTDKGACRTVHAVAPGKARPLASMFKLYVLAATAERVGAGALRWDDRLTITPELKSPSPGGIHTRPDGSEVPVAEAAELMISISDNTATDLLMHEVGRTRVEHRMDRWGAGDRRNVPLLTTRELTVLKWADYPRLFRAYESRGVQGRRAYLRDTVAGVPLSRLAPEPVSREIDSLEWFASPQDICRAYAGLERLAERPGLAPVGTALSRSDAGLDLDPADWPDVWFKGGSEGGVLTAGFLARTAAGRTYVVTLLTSDPDRVYDQDAGLAEILALTRGAFALASKA